ncbi:3396_t:CDS:2, partial [Scutellospora calospora]
MCYDTVGKATAILQKFPNKSEQAKNHLKKCQHFIDKQGSIEVASKILGISLEEENEMLNFLNPTLKLPGHRAFSGRILNHKIKVFDNNMMRKFKNNSVRLILAFDSWTNVVNQNIMGAVLITPERE